MTAYYNEFDPKAAAWLRELIKAGHIAAGDVDERSIVDIRPSDLIGYTQCHFFAGIGVWSYALRRAGWPDDRPVWTGSCPCQPFSAAGKGAGFDDERHLWPHFHWLISQCRPDVVFGEQVASKDGLGWFDLVQANMEGAGYSCGAVDTCAAGFGAPHIRQRLYWVGKRLDDTASARHFGTVEEPEANSRHETRLRVSGAGSGFSGVAYTNGWDASAERQQHGRQQRFLSENGSSLRKGREGARPEFGGLADAESIRKCSDEPGSDRGTRFELAGAEQRGDRRNHGSNAQQQSCTSPTNGFWRDADWLFCRDGKWRPVEPGTFPLVDGAAARVGRLRGYGNAIVAPAAQAFIEAYLEVETVTADSPTAANDNTSKEMAV